MEDLDLIDESHVEESGKLPVFLKVMCILTFVGSGLTLLGAIPSLMMEDMTAESVRLMQAMDNPFFDQIIDLEQMMKWQRYINYSNIAGGILGLTGALLMWKRMKVGFYSYVISWIIPVTVYAIGIDYIMNGFFASFGNLGIFINVFFALAFIVLYAVNFKHLTK